MHNFKVKIRRVGFAEFLIIFDLVLIFLAGPMSMVSDFMYNITYLIDIINIFLFLIIIKEEKNKIKQSRYYNIIIKYMFSMFLIVFFTSVFRTNSVLLFFWSCRRYVGYFIFFYACVKYYKGNYINAFKIIYWINFIMAIFEFFVLKKSQDWLGGIFGIIGGTANSPLILFLSISTIIFFVLYFYKKIKLSYLLLTSICSMIVASMGELKIFYFLFIIILVLSILMTKFSVKKLIAIISSIFIIMLGVSMLYKIFPNFDENYFTLDFFLGTYASKHGYTGTHDVNRLYFIPILREFFDSPFESFFGLGLGNCSYINFLEKYSSFFLSNSMLHYDWFSSSLLYIETGYIGLILYFGLFILYTLLLGKYKKQKDNIIYCEISQILSAIIPLFILYNNSMFQVEAYLVYFILAFPFINSIDKKI